MVSIVKVEIFGFLSFSNWPYFNQQVRGARSLDRHLFKTSLRCNGSLNMIYLKDLKENKRFMDIGSTMAKWTGGGGVRVIFFQNLVKIDFE